MCADDHGDASLDRRRRREAADQSGLANPWHRRLLTAGHDRNAISALGIARWQSA